MTTYFACLVAETRPQSNCDSLLCALVNPRADQTDLLGRERSDVCLVVGRWHPGILVIAEMGNIQDERTFRAVAGNDNLAILAPFERVFQAVELQFCLRFLAAVTFDAGLVENGLDVGGVSHALLCCGGRQL